MSFDPKNLLTSEERSAYDCIYLHNHWINIPLLVRPSLALQERSIQASRAIILLNERGLAHILKGDDEKFFDYNYHRFLRWKEIYNSIVECKKDISLRKLEDLKNKAKQIDEFRANKDYVNADLIKKSIIESDRLEIMGSTIDIYKVNVLKTGTEILVRLPQNKMNYVINKNIDELEKKYKDLTIENKVKELMKNVDVSEYIPIEEYFGKLDIDVDESEVDFIL